MSIEFKLPEVSEGVESADIAEVLVSEGDVITAGQTVMEVETEKAVAEIDCPHAGKIEKIHVQAGDTVAIGSVLLTIDADGAASDASAASEQAEQKPEKEKKPESHGAASQEPTRSERETVPPQEPTQASPPASPKAAEPAAQERTTGAAPHAPATSPGPQGGPLPADSALDTPPPPAAPSTRRLARQLGVDLHQVSGTGSGGRITHEDVHTYVRQLTRGGGGGGAAPVALPDFSQFGTVERQKMSKLARTSSANLARSWANVPHVTQQMLVDITDLEAARRSYVQGVGKDGPKVTMTAIAIKAVVAVLRDFPQFNASLDAATDEIILKQYYNVGVAVDTEFGLVVPVIRDCDTKSILQISTELSEIAERARDRRLDMSDMQGGTFTITNLGGIGGSFFTPIVNFPEVAILGMSRSFKQLQLVDGQPVERLMLPLSLSYDHRVINGADAARFVVRLAQDLGNVFQLLLHQ